MGEFTTNHDENLCDKERDSANFGVGGQEGGYPTDVEGVNSDDIIRNGKEEFPVFNVSSEEFFSNNKSDRKHVQFKADSKAKEYMQKTHNGARPFYIKTNNGKQSFVKKLK